jgi:hypothetical protein
MPRFDLNRAINNMKSNLSQKPQRANEEIESETDRIFLQYMEDMVHKKKVKDQTLTLVP